MAMLLLFSLLALASSALGQFQHVNSTKIEAFDIIFLDTPSYLTTLEGDHPFRGSAYVFGEDKMRLIFADPSHEQFVALGWSPLSADVPFLGMSMFWNGTYNSTEKRLNMWVTGSVMPSMHDGFVTGGDNGYSIPLALIEPRENAPPFVQNLQELNGSTLYSVWTDWRNRSDICSYYVGWAWVGEQIQLSVVRTHIHLDAPEGYMFHHNSTIDTAPVATSSRPINKFVPYSNTHKPWIFPLEKSWNGSMTDLMVIDPGSHTLSVLSYTGNHIPLVPQTSTWIHPPHGGARELVSARLSVSQQLVYVGWSGQGINPGGITAYQINAPYAMVHNFSFQDPWHSRPQALSVDDKTGELYVGFMGGNMILKLGPDLSFRGFQNVPFFINQIYDAYNDYDWRHVWFSTHEQHSKVFRVNKTDFCTTACFGFMDFSSYCSEGKCVCSHGFDMTKDKYNNDVCVPHRDTVTNTVTVEKKGAVAALSVFFVIFVLVAAAGWYFVWKNRAGGPNYRPIS